MRDRFIVCGDGTHRHPTHHQQTHRTARDCLPARYVPPTDIQAVTSAAEVARTVWANFFVSLCVGLRGWTAELSLGSQARTSFRQQDARHATEHGGFALSDTRFAEYIQSAAAEVKRNLAR